MPRRRPFRVVDRTGPKALDTRPDHDNTVSQPELRGPHDTLRVPDGVDDLEAKRLDEELQGLRGVGVVEVGDDLRRTGGSCVSHCVRH